MLVLARLITLLAFAGLYVSGVLSLGHLLGIAPACGGSSSCAQVAGHPSSSIAGVPLAYLGFLLYLAIAGLSIWRQTGPPVHLHRRITQAGFGLSFLGTAASVYLAWISATVIRAFCPWCLASGGIMIALALLHGFSLARKPGPTVERMARSEGAAMPMAGILALVLVAALGGHALSPKGGDVPVGIKTDVLESISRSRLEPPGAPDLGSRDAKVTAVVFSDLMCPTCRQAHDVLTGYAKAGRLRLVFRHLPLHRLEGHENSLLAAGMSELARERGKFWEFTQAIYALPERPSPAKMVDLLAQLGLDRETVEKRLLNNDDRVVHRVNTDIALAEELGLTTTPSIILIPRDDEPVPATIRSVDRLLKQIEGG